MCDLSPSKRLEKEIDVLEFGEAAPAAPEENSAARSPVRPPSASPAKEEQKSDALVNSQQVRVSWRSQVLSDTHHFLSVRKCRPCDPRDSA